MKDKLQEAAYNHAEQQDTDVQKYKEWAINDFISGAQYQANEDKQSIDELVSALEKCRNGFKELYELGLYPESFLQEKGGQGMQFLNDLISKHKTTTNDK